MTTLIGGLYLAVAIVMLVQVGLRLWHRDYVRAWLGLVWASLIVRLMVRYLLANGEGANWLQWAGYWAAHDAVIGVQLAMVLVAATFVLILDWEQK